MLVGSPVSLAFLASLVVLVRKEYREPMGPMELMDPRDLRVNKVERESLVPLDHEAILEMLDMRCVGWLVTQAIYAIVMPYS